jgi:flagellar hook-length control protein FliK
VAATAAASAQVTTTSAATTDETAPAAATTATTPAATAKITVQAVTDGAVAAAVAPQPVQTDVTVASAATDGVLAASVTPATPVAPKTGFAKVPTPAKAATAATDSLDTTSAAQDSTATTVPTGTAQNGTAQPAAPAAKPGETVSDTAKTDAVAGAAPAPGTTIHDHLAGETKAAADSLDAGATTTGAIPLQLPAAAVTAAPIAPLAVSAATGTAVPLSGLALEIAVTARSGKSSFEIRLDPADLGRIDVRIDVDSTGQVTSHLTVEKPETLSMLKQDAPQLQQALDDAGFKTGSNGLQFSLRDQSSFGQNSGGDSRPNAQRLIISDDDTVPAVVAGRSYGRMLGSSSGVDISV